MYNLLRYNRIATKKDGYRTPEYEKKIDASHVSNDHPDEIIYGVAICHKQNHSYRSQELVLLAAGRA